MGKSGEVITLVNDRDVRELRKMMRQLDNQLAEIFVSHGQIVEEKIEGEEEVITPKEKKKSPLPEAKKQSAAPKMEKQAKPKKKKNRTNRNKNKGASWK